jgi:hypothetical protein
MVCKRFKAERIFLGNFRLLEGKKKAKKISKKRRAELFPDDGMNTVHNGHNLFCEIMKHRLENFL